MGYLCTQIFPEATFTLDIYKYYPILGCLVLIVLVQNVLPDDEQSSNTQYTDSENFRAIQIHESGSQKSARLGMGKNIK